MLAGLMRARRSCLSVPASSPRMLAKARELPADELVLDLEDSVLPEAKDEARAALAAALRAGLGARTVSVRINAVGTRWCDRDVVELVEGAGGRLDCLTIPKVDSAGDVAFVDRLLDAVEQRTGAGAAVRPIGLEALIETAAGLARAGEIARASPRLEALIIGFADLRASLGMPAQPSGGGERLQHARATVLVAARAAGLQAIDGPDLRVDDADGLREEAGLARELGYDGKWAIHPGQIDPLNELFSPAPAEVERARAVLDALRDAGRGAAKLEGEMIDEASGKLAEQVVARAEAAAAR
jgi:citrate lyase subunit beta / citryl-CoA lyase